MVDRVQICGFQARYANFEKGKGQRLVQLEVSDVVKVAYLQV